MRATFEGVQVSHVSPGRGPERLELDVNLPKSLFGNNAQLLTGDELLHASQAAEDVLARRFGIVVRLTDFNLTRLEVAQDLRISNPEAFRVGMRRVANTVTLRSQATASVSYRQRHSSYLRVGTQNAAVVVYDKLGEVRKTAPSLLKDSAVEAALTNVFRVETRFQMARCSRKLWPFRSLDHVLENMERLRVFHEQRSGPILREILVREGENDDLRELALKVRPMRQAETFLLMVAIRAHGFDRAVAGFELSARDKSRKRSELRKLGLDC